MTLEEYNKNVAKIISMDIPEENRKRYLNAIDSVFNREKTWEENNAEFKKATREENKETKERYEERQKQQKLEYETKMRNDDIDEKLKKLLGLKHRVTGEPVYKMESFLTDDGKYNIQSEFKILETYDQVFGPKEAREEAVKQSIYKQQPEPKTEIAQEPESKEEQSQEIETTNEVENEIAQTPETPIEQTVENNNIDQNESVQANSPTVSIEQSQNTNEDEELQKIINDARENSATEEKRSLVSRIQVGAEKIKKAVTDKMKGADKAVVVATALAGVAIFVAPAAVAGAAMVGAAGYTYNEYNKGRKL